MLSNGGDGIFGIEAASRHYFGKSAASLSPREAARLVAVLPNPIRFKVNGSSRYIEKRTSIIFARMSGKKIALDDDLNEAPPEESEPDASDKDIQPDQIKEENLKAPLVEQPEKNSQPENSSAAYDSTK